MAPLDAKILDLLICRAAEDGSSELARLSRAHPASVRRSLVRLWRSGAVSRVWCGAEYTYRATGRIFPPSKPVKAVILDWLGDGRPYPIHEIADSTGRDRRIVAAEVSKLIRVGAIVRNEDSTLQVRS